MITVNDIIADVTAREGAIFGGYIRDIIAGENPSDIDVQFATQSQAENFILSISRRCYIMVVKPERFYNEGYTASNVDRILFNRAIGITHIDVFVGPFPNVKDYDVNMLVQQGKQLFSRHSDPILETISNIKRKQCRELCPIPQRRQRMKEKGWVILTA